MPTIGLASAGPSLSTPHQGRPALEPTDVVRLRLPKRIIAIIQRRAAKMNKSISVYLADQVIHHEVVRKHYLTKRRYWFSLKLTALLWHVHNPIFLGVLH